MTIANLIARFRSLSTSAFRSNTAPDTAINGLFRALLGREAEPAALATFRRLDSVEAVAAAIVTSEEFASKHGKSSPFWHYQSRFDAQALMQKFAAKNVQQRPGLIMNFLGVAVAPKFLPLILDRMVGEVQPMPLPANWHADIAEWGAVLRAIDLAKKSFTMVELGCGWGCWINNACVTAKRHGLRVHGIGVEGDAGHIELAKEACALNGLGPDEITLHNAIAGGRDGYALFPIQENPGHAWGLEAVFDATPEQREQATREKTHNELRSMSLETVSQSRRLDLLHIDIQGAEVSVVQSSLDFLTRSVAYMMIGTHSRQIEGQLMDMLLAKGWQLEIERPAILSLGSRADKPVVSVDGVQGWRNPALLP